MDKIKRWVVDDGCMDEADYGDWVTYEDHRKAINDIVDEVKKILNEEFVKLKEGVIETHKQAVDAIRANG